MAESNEAPAAYRKFILGDTLDEAIEDLIAQGKLNQESKELAMKQYDKSILEGLIKHTRARVVLKGKCHTVNFVNNTYAFSMENTLFKIDNQTEKIDSVKVVCLDAKTYMSSADVSQQQQQQHSSSSEPTSSRGSGSSASKKGASGGKKRGTTKRKKQKQGESNKDL